jgi:hypothetical protein
MSKEIFELDRKIVEQKYPDYESKYRALGAVDASDFNEDLVKELDSASAFALWYAAQEALDIDNAPMLNLIALASLKSITEFHRKAQLADLSEPKLTYDGESIPDNIRLWGENFQHVYDEIAVAKSTTALVSS